MLLSLLCMCVYFVCTGNYDTCEFSCYFSWFASLFVINIICIVFFLWLLFVLASHFVHLHISFAYYFAGKQRNDLRPIYGLAYQVHALWKSRWTRTMSTYGTTHISFVQLKFSIACTASRSKEEIIKHVETIWQHRVSSIECEFQCVMWNSFRKLALPILSRIYKYDDIYCYDYYCFEWPRPIGIHVMCPGSIYTYQIHEHTIEWLLSNGHWLMHNASCARGSSYHRILLLEMRMNGSRCRNDSKIEITTNYEKTKSKTAGEEGSRQLVYQQQYAMEKYVDHLWSVAFIPLSVTQATLPSEWTTLSTASHQVRINKKEWSQLYNIVKREIAWHDDDKRHIHHRHNFLDCYELLYSAFLYWFFFLFPASDLKLPPYFAMSSIIS